MLGLGFRDIIGYLGFGYYSSSGTRFWEVFKRLSARTPGVLQSGYLNEDSYRHPIAPARPLKHRTSYSLNSFKRVPGNTWPAAVSLLHFLGPVKGLSGDI